MAHICICEQCQLPFDVGFASETRRFCCRPCWRIYVATHKSPRDKRVEITCPICGKPFLTKQDRLNKIKTRICCSVECNIIYKRRHRQEEIEQQFGEPIHDLLCRLYHTEQRPIREVSKIIGVSSRNVFEWFYDLNIPRRERSLAVAMQWTGNDERRRTASKAMRAMIPIDFDERRRNSVNANLVLQQQRGPTSIERIMAAALNDAGIIFEFQFAVGGKFLCDFALPAHLLIVECDGEYWHNTPRQRRQDASKDAYLQACGYTVIRFSDKQIRQDIHSCIQAIKTRLPLQNTDSAGERERDTHCRCWGA